MLRIGVVTTVAMAFLMLGQLMLGQAMLASEAEDTRTALNLAKLIQAARSVISANQDLINDPEIGDKGLTGYVVLAAVEGDPQHAARPGGLVAGVIGSHKFIYDIWGETVNTASRMESHGLPGRIAVSGETYRRLHDSHVFERRGVIDLRGSGSIESWFLQGRRTASPER